MAKYAAYGIALQRTGTEIVGVTSITGPGLSLETVDVTSHDQAEAWEEVRATILRSGEITLDIIYDPNTATHKNLVGGLLYDLAQRTKVDTYTLVFPGAVTWTFDQGVYVTGFEPTGEIGGALTASVKLKLTGKPALV